MTTSHAPTKHIRLTPEGAAALRDLLAATNEPERRREIEGILARAEVVQPMDESGGVALGALVTLHTAGKQMKVRVVSPQEARVREGGGVSRVGEDSPVGRELLGRRTGERFDVTLAGGRVMEYEVMSVGK